MAMIFIIAYQSLDIPFDLRRTKGPISPLPQYFRVPAKLNSPEDADKPFIVFIPIRLGKRHAARFPNLVSHRPYFWEYIKNKKRSPVTPNHFTTGGRNILTSPSTRTKRNSEEDDKIFNRLIFKDHLDISNPASTWTDVVHDMYNKIEHNLQNNKNPSTIQKDTKYDNIISNQVRYTMILIS